MKAEDVLQINFINWFKYNYPEEERDSWHTANERSCSIQQGRLLKRMGVKSGVADVFVAVPKNGYHGLFLELKEGKGKISKEQQAFLARMTARGYMAVCVWGLNDAKQIIKSYLGDRDT